MRNDLSDRNQVEILVNKFYERVRADELLAPLFIHVDWVKHLPVMYDFWSSLLLGEQTYRGNPFQPHAVLKLEERHFNQWVTLFVATVEENFDGEKAREAIQRAQAIAGVWQHKMGIASKA